MKKIIAMGITGMFLLTSLTAASPLKMEEDEEYVVPDYVEIGDLLYMNYQRKHQPLRDIDPIAMYIGDNKFVYANRVSGVTVKDYTYFMTHYKWHVFGYIQTANSSQKIDAARWAQSKVGQRFQHLPRISKKGSNDRWYPTELIWAAYYNQGIDIDQNGWDNPRLVTTEEIIDDFDTETYIIHPVPSYVQRGDILFMDLKLKFSSYWAIPGYSNEHASIYLGHDYRDGSYFIDGGGPRVGYITYDYIHIFGENFTFYYVTNANESQIERAIEWAENQLGAKYQCFLPQLFNPKWWYKGMFELGEKCADPENKTIKTAGRFYCSELVWAAYYSQGIDIDQNGWAIKKPVLNNKVGKFFINWWKRYGWAFAYVDCDDITESKNTTERLPLL